MTTNNAIDISLPPFTKINVQVISSTATYTPTAGTKYLTAEIVGDGGGGGGVTGGTVGQGAAASGGGGGGYCKKTYTIAQLGANAAVVIGTGGAGGASGANNGTAGSGSTFTPAGAGATLAASGGGAGTAMSKSASAQVVSGAAGGNATGGDINILGSPSGFASTLAAGVGSFSSAGGTSFWSGGQTPIQFLPPNNSHAGTVGNGYGTGGSGACDANQGNQAGGNGSAGLCVVTEYISV